MNRIFKLKNPIQPYAWGSRTALAELLGQNSPASHPQAELWMGAHSKSSSKVWYQGRWQNLEELVRDDAAGIVGPSVTHRYDNFFPFLFKVLAVEEPLSIQAHPNRDQARTGFMRENEAGIALHADHRNYRDNRHKPELICALTPFWALCGFRAPHDILAALESLWPPEYNNELDPLRKNNSEGIRIVFENLMRLPKAARQVIVGHAALKADQRADQDPMCRWIARLNKAYPGDAGVIAPVLLNLICLQPGQALFLPAGRLHAYLNGLAVELMANSDNVLRGGLTSKHLDVEELLNILDFNWTPVKILEPVPISSSEGQYPSQAEEFILSVIKIASGVVHAAANRFPGPEILLCLNGEATLHWDNAKSLTLTKGESVLVTSGVVDYRLTGDAIIYKAAVHHA